MTQATSTLTRAALRRRCEVGHIGRSSSLRTVRAARVAEADVGGDAYTSGAHSVVGLEVDPSHFTLIHSRSTKTLSHQQPRPSVLMAMPCLGSCILLQLCGALSSFIDDQVFHFGRCADLRRHHLYRCSGSQSTGGARSPPQASNVDVGCSVLTSGPVSRMSAAWRKLRRPG